MLKVNIYFAFQGKTLNNVKRQIHASESFIYSVSLVCYRITRNYHFWYLRFQEIRTLTLQSWSLPFLYYLILLIYFEMYIVPIQPL